MEHQVVVVGGGAAGLNVAALLATKGLDVALVHKGTLGGELPSLEWVEDFPVAGARTGGAELAAAFIDQAQSAGVEFIAGEVKALELYSSSVATILSDHRAITASQVVIATGRRKRHLEGVELDRFEGVGLIGCAACEAVFYRDESVVVCGSGHAGALDALYLSRFAKEVTLIERADVLGCSDALQNRLQAAGNIRMLRSTVLVDVSGAGTMTSVRVRENSSDTRTLRATGLSIQVGHLPETGFLTGAVPVDDLGYVLADPSKQTHTPRVLAIGDVRSGARHKVLDAIADSRVASQRICEILLPQPAA